MTLAKLDVGAGAQKDPEYLALDVVPYFKPGILGTICKLPFADGHFDEVRCHDVLEHVERRDLIPAMNEMWRVLRVGGWVDILVPVYPHLEAVADPTHLSFFHSVSFEYFIRCEYDHAKAEKPERDTQNGISRHMIHSPDHHCYEVQRVLYGIQPWSQMQTRRYQSGAKLHVRMVKVTKDVRLCVHTRVSRQTLKCLDCGEKLKL